MAKQINGLKDYNDIKWFLYIVKRDYILGKYQNN